MMDDIGDEQLLYLVGSTDKKLFEEGIDISQRGFEVERMVMQELGHYSWVITGYYQPKILTRIQNAYGSIYLKKDLEIGGHIGVFMYRDVFCKISVPHIFGETAINPFDFVALTPVQLRIIQTEPVEMKKYMDQFTDVFDVYYGKNQLNAPFRDIELVARYVELSTFQIHAAAAILTGGYDFRGAVQSALLSIELALKAALAAQSLSWQDIKMTFGHKRDEMISAIEPVWPNFDASRVRNAVRSQPDFAHNRYSKIQPDRRKVGHIVMGAQYVLSEVVRQMSNCNFRLNITPTPPRTYPE